MPAALTLILICPAPGSGSGTPAHFSTSGGPYSVSTIALGIAVILSGSGLGLTANGKVNEFVVRCSLLRRSRLAPGPRVGQINRASGFFLRGVGYARLSSSTGMVRTPAVWRVYSAKPG